MTKVLGFIMAVFLYLPLFSQVRLNEIFLANNSQNKQWIELFSSGTLVEGYTLAIRYKQHKTDSGFYLLRLSGAANADHYFVAAYNDNVNWLNTSAVIKVRWDGVSQALTSAESNQVMDPSGENHVFLVKNNKVVDILVTGITGTSMPYLKAQAAINTWASFSAPDGFGFDGFSIVFNKIQLTNLNTPNESAGSGSSFSFIYAEKGCNTEYPWVKTSTETKGYLNDESSVPQYDYWEVTYKISSSFARAASDFFAVTNSRIPNASPTFDYASSGSPTVLYLKYTLSNTLLSAAIENPVFYMYYDKGGLNDLPNGVLDDKDPVVISGISKSLETSNTIYLSTTITPDMFYTDDLLNNKLRPLFLVLVSQNTCFKSQHILVSEQLYALPVTLGSFDVKSNGHGNVLKWSTLSESNNAGFEIQQSFGSPTVFKKIGFLDSKAKNGNSRVVVHYSFQDSPIMGIGSVFYRLKQIDMDGKFTYSPIKAIKREISIAGLQVYPNPSNGSINIQIGRQAKCTIMLLDQDGQLVKRMTTNSGVLRMEGLKNGFYFLKLRTDEGEILTRKIIVE